MAFNQSKMICRLSGFLGALFLVLIVGLGTYGCNSSGGTAAGGTGGEDAAAPTPVDSVDGDGNVLYSFEGSFFLIGGAEGAVPQDMDALFTAAGAGAGEEEMMGISRNGDYLVVTTTRFDGCEWACLARFNVDGTDGEKVTVGADGEDLHVETSLPAISADGSTIVFTQGYDDPDDSVDLFATTRSAAGVWSALTNITASSTYTYNTQATISADGTRVAFVCSNSLDESLDNNICEVDIDGDNYAATIVAGTDNDFTNVMRPSYANNGDLLFEGNLPDGSDGTDGERIWRLAAARTAAATPAGDFLNAVSPCAMPNGSLAFLWLGRPGTDGRHELTMSDTDDEFAFTLFDEDVDDIGMSCSE